MEPIIEIKNLTHIYSPNTPFEQRALDQVNLTIYRGEYLGIIGRTGSGKSTLIQHLNGLIRPTEGEVLFQGQDIWSSKELTHNIRFQVGLVFQYPEYQLFEETVYKDIAFGPRNMKLDEPEIDRRVRQAAAFAGLSEEILARSPFELSGGQKRRVAIAGVIAMEPECIVLDEATAMLDPSGRREVLDTVHRLNRERGITVVHITHHMSEAEDADRVIVMNDGVVAMDGAPREIFSRVEELQALGLAAPDTVELLRRLNRHGMDLPLTAITVDECARAIFQALHGAEGK